LKASILLHCLGTAVVFLYEGNIFTEETRTALQQILPEDKVLVTDIKGSLQQGRGNLKAL
jgi:hypothetical protein